MSLAIRLTTMDDTAVLDLVGDFDMASISRFRTAADAITRTTAPLVVDLRSVDFMDSAGLGALCRLAQNTDGVPRQVALVFENARYATLLELAGLKDHFVLASSVREAITAIRAARNGSVAYPTEVDM